MTTPEISDFDAGRSGPRTRPGPLSSFPGGSEKKVFLKKYLVNPVSMGSITPSSRYLSREIARLVESLETTRIVELGPGTGALTNYLHSRAPTVVEIDAEMCRLLGRKFPGLKVVNACAIDFLKGVDFPCGIVLSIPLINNPLKVRLVKELRRLYENELLKWCVIYTYGFRNPLEDIGFRSMKRHKTVLRNFPPAHIWCYR